MRKRLWKTSFVIIALLSIMLPGTALAIPPPDFIIQVASQAGAFFAIGFVLCSAIFSMVYQYIKGYAKSHRKTFWAISTVVILSTSWIGAYFYDQQYQQKQQLKLTGQWLEESPAQILKSSATVSIQPTPPANTDTVQKTENKIDFYELNKNLDEKISNEEFNTVISNKNLADYIILDTRENIEYELGRIPGSTHIRLADLKAGGWAELPTDKYIYVICWSGMRGKEVTDFLKDKKRVARYLEKGLIDWVTFKGKWEGEVDFYKVFHEEKYNLVFTTGQVKKMLKEGVILVDSREPEKYLTKHITGAINIPTLHIPSRLLPSYYAQIKKGMKVITICDELVSCFDATVTGIELEKRGAIFLGKYYKPGDL